MRSVYIAGAHSRARTLKAYLEYLYPDITIEAFLADNMSENAPMVDGIPVRLIETGLHTDYPVYIGTRSVNHPKLTEELSAAGMKIIIPVTQDLDMQLRNEYVRRFFQSQGRIFETIDELCTEE